MRARIWARIGKKLKEGIWSGGCAVTELFFPRICVVCGDSLMRGEKYICSSCLADFPFSDPDYATQDSVLDCFNEHCRPENLYSLFYYNKYSPYKNLIYRIKYRFHKELGVYLGRMLGERILNQCHADCIIPVPLHPKREKRRGFNQSREIARGISEVLGIEIYDDVIFRIQNNASQTGKNADERLKNVQHIFELRNPQKIRGHHILLVDDVITTGATIGACVAVLSRSEAISVSLGCLAQTV